MLFLIMMAFKGLGPPEKLSDKLKIFNWFCSLCFTAEWHRLSTICHRGAYRTPRPLTEFQEAASPWSRDKRDREKRVGRWRNLDELDPYNVWDKLTPTMTTGKV